MKKSIFLIAPLTLLISCTGTSEIFDDAYNDISAPAVEKAEENKGYADYIKSEEKNYPLEVEESSEGRTMDGLNPSYYGQNGNSSGEGHYHTNSQTNIQPNIQGGFYSGYGNYYNSPYGYSGNCNSWRVCQYACMTWHNTGRCWHVNGNMYGNSYFNNGQYYDIVYGTNDPHAPNGWYGTGGSPYYGGYYNNYYGNNYYCGNYGSYYGNGGYYGNNWYNPYGNNGWGPNWGWNGLYFYNFNNSNNGNNNWNNNQDNETSSGNHHFGHRGGSNSGSNSQNSSSYEHTVHAPVQTNTSPFPAFAEESAMVGSTEINSKPLNNASFESKPITNSGNQIVSDPVKPDVVNSNSANEPTGFFSGSKPNGNQSGYVTDNTVSKPVNGNNNFSGGSNTKPVITNSGTTISKGKPANNQFAPTTVPNYSTPERDNTNSGNNNTTYDNPNKYGNNNNNSNNNGYKPDYSPSYGGGTTNSNNRRSNDGGTYSSGSSNRSGGSGSNYNGNRSSGSGSNTNSGSSGSSGKSSGTGGGTSRRN